MFRLVAKTTRRGVRRFRLSIPTDLLPFFRNHWATRFTDSCVVKRTVDPSTFNDTTGQYEPTFTTNYSGGCLVRPQSPAEVAYGQEEVGTRGYNVYLPYNETDQLRGDLVDITSTTDGFLTGKSFVVTNVFGDTYNTRRVLVCEEVV